MARMGVSRTVVREAVAALRAEGLVITRQGAGAFVAADAGRMPFRIDPDGLGSIGDVLEVMELRLAIEVEGGGARRRARHAGAAPPSPDAARHRGRHSAARAPSTRTSPSIARHRRGHRQPALCRASSSTSAATSSRARAFGCPGARRRSSGTICEHPEGAAAHRRGDPRSGATAPRRPCARICQQPAALSPAGAPVAEGDPGA